MSIKYYPTTSGSGGSGVSQIVAGTNVTISPSGGTGAVTINSSGGGSPGGSSGQIQYNNAGAFGGASIYYAAPAYGSGNNIQVGIGQAANTSWSGNSYIPASILQVGSTAAIWSGYYGGPNNTHFTNNIYYDNTYWRFINTGGGTLLNMNNGTCTFYVMPNGSAGGIASISAAMVISNDGGVQVGAPTGGDQGLGTLNATGLYVNGVAVPSNASGANAYTTLTYAATITPVVNAAIVRYAITATGNLTVAVPSDTGDNDTCYLRILSSGGAWTLTMSAYQLPSSGIVVTWPYTMTSGKEYDVIIQYSALRSQWQIVQFLGAY